MSETNNLPTPTQRVFLWTLPRSLSTILLKCLSYAEDIQLQVINEPYVSAYYYGPEKKCSNNSVEDKFENVFKTAGKTITSYNSYDDQLSTYRWVKELLEAEYPGKDLVFCKDHAYCLRGSYDMLPKGYKHTFLIRHPQRAFPSLKKITESVCSVDFTQMERKDFPEPMHSGYQRLFELMDHLEVTGEPHPIIIDADDLQSHPESIVKQYCEAIGKYLCDFFLIFVCLLVSPPPLDAFFWTYYFKQWNKLYLKYRKKMK